MPNKMIFWIPLLLIGGFVTLLIVVMWRQSSRYLPQNAEEATWANPPVHALRVLESKRILFGHMSVGRDILKGMGEVLSRTAGDQILVHELDHKSDLTQTGIYHFLLGSNGDPYSKIDHFKNTVTDFTTPPPDAVMMKFCYVDIKTSTDLTELESAYSAAVHDIETRLPETRVIHLTAAIESEPMGSKTQLRRAIGGLVGKAGPVGDNRQREAYNAWLRKTFGGFGNLIDLAAIESSCSKGLCRSRIDFSVPMLATDYTSDGGHLNITGRNHVALSVLSELSRILELD